MQVIIQARMNSQRFPGKVLRYLVGKPLLEHVIERSKQSKADVVTVATIEPADEIRELCTGLGVQCHVSHKPSFDVLGRFTECLEDDVIVRVCGDNPLIRPDCMDAVAHHIGLADYCGYQYNDAPAIVRPNGLFPEAVSADALRRADRELSGASPFREHVTWPLYRSPREYRCVWLQTPADYAGQCWSVDTPEDLLRVERHLWHECNSTG